VAAWIWFHSQSEDFSITLTLSFQTSLIFILLLSIGADARGLICGGISLHSTPANNKLRPTPEHEDRSPEAINVPPRFELEAHNSRLVVGGLPEKFLGELKETQISQDDWRKILPVYVAELLEKDTTQPPLLGSYKITTQVIYFKPRFAFEPGLVYRVKFDTEKLASLVTFSRSAFQYDFSLPEIERPATEVTSIFPSAGVLPENLLRLYIHFSAPVVQAGISRHIKLFEDEREVELPFVEIENGLWDKTGTRLTLFFHPGRIKRDVGPNMKMGSVLKVGKKYRLLVQNTLQDVNRKPLANTFVKEFEVSTPDRTPPVITKWHLSQPEPASKSSLILNSTTPIDHALFTRMLRVVNDNQELVSGRVAVSNSETRWAFTPDEPWAPGMYLLLANPALEDLAGNRLDGVFDKATEIKNDRDNNNNQLSIAFKIEN